MTKTPENKFSAIIVAAGSGERFGGYKQLIKINGRFVVEIVLDTFYKCGASELILVLRKDLFNNFEYLKKRFDIPLKFVEGGRKRGDSVYNGVRASSYDYVLIHDAARPYLSCALIRRVLSALKHNSAVIPAIPVRDTIIKIEKARVVGNIDRENLRSVQTPQGFKKDVLQRAFGIAKKKGLYFTDESTMLLETLGIGSYLVQGEHWNFKITFREDLSMLRHTQCTMGYDIHRLRKGGMLKIGGEVIEKGISPVAHSDGDVVLHALIDALLAIKGKDDIGTMFPDDDEKWKDADSTILLQRVMEILKDITILKVDIICILEHIKLAPFKERIRENISSYLQVPKENISFKAKTKEGIGEVGSGKAIEAYCIVSYLA